MCKMMFLSNLIQFILSTTKAPSESDGALNVIQQKNDFQQPHKADGKSGGEVPEF